MIDVSDLHRIPLNELSMEVDCVRAISQACRTWGFFQITGHGVSEEMMHRFHT
jgi:isopenicillin N synthase-like dioxygenase